MRPIFLAFTATAAGAMLSGCVARAAVDVVTLPVRAAGSGVDAMTTSQSEADEKRGREVRRREERLGRLDRSYRRHNAQCARGDRDACTAARAEHAEMQSLTDGVPAGGGYRD